MKELTLKIILKDYTDTRANHTMLDLKEITKCQITSQMMAKGCFWCIDVWPTQCFLTIELISNIQKLEDFI